MAFTNTYLTVHNVDTGLSAGATVVTLGYDTPGDGGGALYLVVDVPPPAPQYLTTVNHVLVTGTKWLILQHNGYINMRQAGAKGDGDLALGSAKGVDDYNAFRDVLEMANDGIVSEIYVPKGIYNIKSTLKFYKDATTDGSRGNFQFRGAGPTRPRLFRDAIPSSNGTVLKMYTESYLDINTMTTTGTPTSYKVNDSMSAVELSGFSVIGDNTSQLIKSFGLVGNSWVHDVTFYQKGAGKGWLFGSCYNGLFENIVGIGASTIESGSVGMYCETDYGLGGEFCMDSVTIENFDTGFYFGNTLWGDTRAYGGLNDCIFRNIQASNNNTNVDTGICFQDRTGTEDGTGVLSFYNPRFEFSAMAGGANIRLKRCTSLYIQGGLSSGTTAFNVDHIIVSDEFTDNNENGECAPANSYQGGSIVIDGIQVSLTQGKSVEGVGEPLINLPDRSWYKVILTNLFGRMYLNSNGACLIRLNNTGSNKFYGTIKINNNNIVGMSAIASNVSVIQSFFSGTKYTEITITDATYNLHPQSNALHIPYSIGSGSTESIFFTDNTAGVAKTDLSVGNATLLLDLSHRPYLPAMIHCKGAAVIILPNAADFLQSRGVIHEIGHITSITTTTGNVILVDSSSSMTISGAPGRYQITTRVDNTVSAVNYVVSAFLKSLAI